MKDTYEKDLLTSRKLIEYALTLAKAGDWNAAWETAKHDPLIGKDATRENWERWAKIRLAAQEKRK